MAGTYTITVLPAHYNGSESGNRTLGICVTGRDVTNYTKSDEGQGAWQAAPDIFLEKNNFPGFFRKKKFAQVFLEFPFCDVAPRCSLWNVPWALRDQAETAGRKTYIHEAEER